MANPKGYLVVPVGFDPDGDIRALELDANDYLKVAESSGDFAAMLTALEKIDDLRNALNSVATDKLDVSVKDSALPSGASTSAKQITMLTALQKIDDLQNALASVATDKLGVIVDSSALPAGAATAAKQTTMITALQLIDDLRNALNSVATDKLDVSVKDSALPSGAATAAAQASLLTELGQKLETADLELVSKIISQGPHGWYGGAWQRQPLLIGYSGDKSAEITDLDAGAGLNTLNGSIVPAGEIWNVQTIGAVNQNTASSSITFMVMVNSVGVWLETDNAPIAGVPTGWSGSIVISEGDNVRVVFRGANLGDDLYVRYHAVKVDIDQ